MMVQPILTYCSFVKLLYIVIQHKKLKSLESQDEHITGQKLSCITSTINKKACCLVKRSLDENLYVNFNDYFEINYHSTIARNS